jgi:Tol biopolymer transport system component
MQRPVRAGPPLITSTIVPFIVSALWACSGTPPALDGGIADAAVADAGADAGGPTDAGAGDAGPPDAGAPDGGSACPAPSLHLVVASPEGGRVNWSHDGSTIALDGLGDAGCYDVYTINPDGTNPRCTTCGNTHFSASQSKGCPAFHPNGQFMVMEVEVPDSSGNGCKYAPGAAVQQEVWALSLSTGAAYPLVSLNVSSDLDTAILGTLHPKISPDGAHMLWAELYAEPDSSEEFGYYRLMIGDVAIDGGTLVLTNPRKLLPTADSGTGSLESNSFSFDSARIGFTSNLGDTEVVTSRQDVFTANLDGTDVQAVTHENYNEHIELAPSGQHVAYMSSSYRSPAQSSLDGTEYFLSSVDGSNACQVSHFNEPGYPESHALPALASVSSWSPDGMHLAAYVQGQGIRETWILDFVSPQ